MAAVSDRVDHNWRVVSDKDCETGQDMSYMLHKPSKRFIKMVRVGNVWVVEATVHLNVDEPFARQP